MHGFFEDLTFKGMGSLNTLKFPNGQIEGRTIHVSDPDWHLIPGFDAIGFMFGLIAS